MIKQHTRWVDKYRPSSINEYIGNDVIKRQISKWVSNEDIPHLLFSGTPGTGKSSLAKLIIQNISCDFLYINAADENGIETIREKVKRFAVAGTFKKIKIVILDEAAFLTRQAQPVLLNILEEYSVNTRFIFTTNDESAIIEPLRSRCETYKIVPPSKQEVAEQISIILDKENISYKMTDLVPLVNTQYPDIRSCIKMAQALSFEGKLEIDLDKLNDSGVSNKIISILKTPTKTAWLDIRQIVSNAHLKNFEFIYQNMYKSFSSPEITLILAEFQYKSAFVPDKEINFMGLVAEILKQNS